MAAHYCVLKNRELISKMEKRKTLAPQGFMAEFNGAPDTIRTYDLQFRKLSLYPAELRARIESNIP
jgi:hypothetical protein